MNKYFIAGFIAGEGCFSFYEKRNTPGKLPKNAQCYFGIEVHIRDKHIIEEIQETLKEGKIAVYPYRPNIVRFTIHGFEKCKRSVVPFMDKYLIASYKKEQYLTWREKLMSHGLSTG